PVKLHTTATCRPTRSYPPSRYPGKWWNKVPYDIQPYSTTARCPWGRRWNCSTAPPKARTAPAGTSPAAGRTRPPSSCSAGFDGAEEGHNKFSQKKLQKSDKKVLQIGDKRVTI